MEGAKDWEMGEELILRLTNQSLANSWPVSMASLVAVFPPSLQDYHHSPSHTLWHRYCDLMRVCFSSS